MKRLIFLFLLPFLLVFCKEAEKKESALNVSYGFVERLDSFPSEYIRARNVDILLPEGYSRDKKYPVLYMHDGQMLYDSTDTWNGQEWGVDENLGRLIAEGKVPEIIVVGIWNISAIRHSDYFPEKPSLQLEAEFLDSMINEIGRDSGYPVFTEEIHSDNYLKFITSELKPFIDENYATLPDQSNTYIAGSSMGGLISWYALCEYPDVFGAAACLSTHWPGIFTAENNPIPAAFNQYLKENLPPPGNNRIYFDYGTTTLDAMYEPFQLMVDSTMIERGYDETNWTTLKFEGKDHSEIAWNERLEIPLTFLFQKEEE